MSPNQKARIATGIVIGTLATGILWKQGLLQRETVLAQETVAPQPQDPIYQSLDAIRDRDLPRYLDAHTGAMAESLRRASAEIGEARLLQSLRDVNAPLKGVAINEPEYLSSNQVKAKVEYVFADRNETQIYSLEKSGGRWKIAQVQGAQRIETLIPYGSPVR